jgi:hypothetical protein
MEDLTAAIEALQRARETKSAELDAICQALAALGVRPARETPVRTHAEFEHLGIVAATKRYLSEEGAPRTTREIANALDARGVRTKSKNFAATVYATLDKADEFERNDGKWELRAAIA